MFKFVRLKLTLINISVVGIVLLLFFSGIYMLMKENTTQLSEQLMRSVTNQNRFRRQRQFPLQFRHWANCFYIRKDISGNTVEQSPDLPVSEDELNRLVLEAQRQDAADGIIRTDSDTFRFLKYYPPDNYDTTLVFLSTQPENETLGRLRTVLIFIGLTGLVIVFISSLFLADRAIIPIRKSWERQKNFVADASHELRSPLAVIQTNLELVMGNKEETVESQSKWLENVQTENKIMTKLVNDLLFLARADSNQQMVERNFFELNKILEEAMTIFEPIASKKDMKLTLHTDSKVDFFGDETRIKQLMVILIDNAIKYSPAGGLVLLHLKSPDGHVEIIVSDNGEGIAQEHINRIFERFYRVDKARSRENGGTGLGLAIADWIVKEHRGFINVISTPGKGTTFRIVFPKVLRKIK